VAAGPEDESGEEQARRDPASAPEKLAEDGDGERDSDEKHAQQWPAIKKNKQEQGGRAEEQCEKPSCPDGD
jgi:hypothetical protein